MRSKIGNFHFQYLLLAGLALIGPSRAGMGQPGSSGGMKEVKQIFLRGLNAPTMDERVEAVGELVLSGLPEGIGLMQEALVSTSRHRARLQKRYAALGKKANALTRKRLQIPGRAHEVFKEREKVGAHLARDEATIKALREGMGRLYTTLSPAFKKKTIAPLILRLSKSRKLEDRISLLETLGHLNGSLAIEAIHPHLASKDPEVRIVAIEAVGRQGDRSAVLALAKSLEDTFWQVRVVAIDALTQVGGATSVEALILAMARCEGRIMQDIIAALKKLTGQNFHDNRALWRKWWMENRAGYTGPPDAPTKKDEDETEKDEAIKKWQDRTGGIAFYGIRSRSKRIVYILDISNSMNMPLGATRPTQTGRMVMGAHGNRKMDQAIGELTSSITSLPEDATFNIVFYNHEVRVWNKRQVQATAGNKKKAIAWTRTITASGNTNIFDALERAFKLAGRGTFDAGYAIAADTFYLLSDGISNRGRIIDRNEMLQETARPNRFRKVMIHTIALGNRSQVDVEFMQGLAGDTGGEFVHIQNRR